MNTQTQKVSKTEQKKEKEKIISEAFDYYQESHRARRTECEKKRLDLMKQLSSEYPEFYSVEKINLLSQFLFDTAINVGWESKHRGDLDYLQMKFQNSIKKSLQPELYESENDEYFPESDKKSFYHPQSNTWYKFEDGKLLPVE